LTIVAYRDSVHGGMDTTTLTAHPVHFGLENGELA